MAQHRSCQIPAKNLDIGYGPEERGQYTQDPNLQVEVFNLTNGKWLHVQGDTEVRSLPSGYVEVFFQLNVKDCNSGWCEYVKFTVTLPDGQEIINNLYLKPYIGKGYTAISVGKFQNNFASGRVGLEMKALNEYYEKSITIRGVNIRPSAH